MDLPHSLHSSLMGIGIIFRTQVGHSFLQKTLSCSISLSLVFLLPYLISFADFASSSQTLNNAIPPLSVFGYLLSLMYPHSLRFQLTTRL